MLLEISQHHATSVALKYWKHLAVAGVGAAAMAFAASLIVPKEFTSSASFLPEKEASGQLPSGLSSLAGQFGISTDDARNSPQFYAKVLSSRSLSLAVANDTFRQGDPPNLTIGELIGCATSNHDKFAECAVRKLDSDTRILIDPRSQIVTVSVEARSPGLAQEMTTSYLRALSAFNVSLRQSNARVRREFLQGRALQAESLLTDTEDALKTFYARNRRIQDSPALQVEEGRLRRAIDRRQEMFLFLMRQLEQAKLDEVRNTPVITVVDRPNRPYRKSAPKTVVWMILATFFTAGGYFAWLIQAAPESPNLS